MGALSALLGNRTAQKSNLCDDIFWRGRAHGHTDPRDLSQRKLSHDMSDFFRYTGHLSILTQILSVIENIS